MGESVRIPADVDREDRLVAGLTARQLALLAVPAVAVVGLWEGIRSVVPTPVFVVVAAPVASVAAVLALGRRDGLPADRFAAAAARHARSNRRLVPAPEGVPSLPPEVPATPLPAALDLPVRDVGADGVVDLGRSGAALLCRASSLNFGLRTDSEQRQLVAAFGRWLNSLTDTVQIVVRAEPVDVAATVAALHNQAPTLPCVELERAAMDHAAFLSRLAAGRDVLRRAVLVVFRAPQRDQAALLAGRAGEAAAALIGAGISLTPLREDEARAVLARAMEADVSRVGTSSAVITGWSA